MATSVKLNTEDKERLERLQALITLKTGVKVTQQELLSTLIKNALERCDELARRMAEPRLPMPDEEYEKLLSLIADWGVETRWEEIDQLVYGSQTRRTREEA